MMIFLNKNSFIRLNFIFKPKRETEVVSLFYGSIIFGVVTLSE
jgi:hypothetical protein